MTDSLYTTLDKFFAMQEQIHREFGYQEQWRYFPIVDKRDYWWHLDESHTLRYWDAYESAMSRDQSHEYDADVYTQRHLEKWVYRTDSCVMILMDTRCDLNVYLGVFDVAKELDVLPRESLDE